MSQNNDATEQFKDIAPVDPTLFYPVDHNTIQYKEDPDNCALWNDDKRTLKAATFRKFIELLSSPSHNG